MYNPLRYYMYTSKRKITQWGYGDGVKRKGHKIRMDNEPEILEENLVPILSQRATLYCITQCGSTVYIGIAMGGPGL